MLRWTLALVFLAVAVLLGLIYVPDSYVEENAIAAFMKESKCPFSLSGVKSHVRGNVAWLAKRLSIPIGWLKLVNLGGIFGEELSRDSITVTLPECTLRPMKESELQKGRHVSLLGQVYDVSTYPEMYGPGAGYEYLTGFDATRDFALAAPPADQADEKTQRLRKGYALDGLETAHLNELMQWMHLFQSKYNCIGYLPGLYYLPTGKSTDYLRQLVTVWESFRRQSLELRNKLPICNNILENEGVYLSCENIKGDFVPRNLYLNTEKVPHCHCVPKNFPQMPNLQAIAGCEANARKCKRTEANDQLVWPKDLRSIKVKPPVEAKK